MQGQFRFILVVIIIIACLIWGLKRHIKNAVLAEEAKKAIAEQTVDSATNNLPTNAASQILIPTTNVAAGQNTALAQQVQIQIQALNDVLTQQVQKQAEVNKKIESALNDLSAHIEGGVSIGSGSNTPDPRVIQLEAMMQVMKARDLIGLSNRLQRVEMMLTRMSTGPAPVSGEQMQQAIDAKLKGIQKDAEQNRLQLKALRDQLDALRIQSTKTKPTVQNQLERSVPRSSTNTSVVGTTQSALKMAPVSRP